MTGGDLFIVDNSASGWTARSYLDQWTEVARSFDVATGFFEIGALLALDGRWQQLEKIRILMGDQVSLRTKNTFSVALKNRLDYLNADLEREKLANPFLRGVEAVVEAIQSGKIECRVYRKRKFHAKAYITHARFDVIGAQALVGSSNFTMPGLSQNIELNIQVQSGREVAQLQQWFEEHWMDADPVSEDVLRVVQRHLHAYTPFEVYAKALHEFFRGHELTAGEWDEQRSQMFPNLDRYQKEAYWSLMKIARRYGGAFLCDGVGLGKTFVGLMLIERLVMHENKRVVVFAPKAAREGVWEPHLKEWLPDLGGVGGTADFSSLVLFSHTDLNRKGEFPARFKHVAAQADAVIIDEAHHFRNRGRQAKPDDIEDRRSRYWRMFELLEGEVRPKLLFLLTATPINNRMADFRHMAELFTRGNDSYFARTLGVNNFTARFSQLEKELQDSLGGDAASLQNDLYEQARHLLAADRIFEALVVQRSRAYAKESQLQERGESAVFPHRRPPRVADYSIRKTYGEMLRMFQQAFERRNPLFSLAIYYPLAHYIGPDEDINPTEENRQKQVVGLIRTLFLKRFESSVHAFERSLDRLMRKLLAFVEIHSESPSERHRYEQWQFDYSDVIGYRPQLSLMFGEDEYTEEAEAEEDIVPQELLESVTDLPRDEYDVAAILDETFEDLDRIAGFLRITRRFRPAQDDKLKKLRRLLDTKDMEGRKVLVFTEFADTARYLYAQLKDAGVEGLAQLDSGSKVNRAEMIRRFSPYYNGSSSAELSEAGKTEIRVLISTDVLSEGLNLQDATRLVNYDIHWNPVRLMQRIGRVDRRLNPKVEESLIADNPNAAADRGKVAYWNFLPPEELNRILSLYTRVTKKTLLISKTLGIEGRKLLTPDDDYDPLKEFNASYEGEKTNTEKMHLEYQKLLRQDLGLAPRLDMMPGSVFSGRRRLARGARGVFFCYALPALDKEMGDFTLEAGPTRWYLYDIESGQVIERVERIINSIRSQPGTPRRCTTEEETLKEVRQKVERHIRNTYLKQVQAPMTAPKHKLLCWMELNR
ncbi:MAG: helicase-related protein [bacterium]|nr:helicase-related protein [bacterium]